MIKEALGRIYLSLFLLFFAAAMLVAPKWAGLHLLEVFNPKKADAERLKRLAETAKAVAEGRQ